MKNIHILPTEQPSRLWIGAITGKLILDKEPNTLHSQHIYITSDEEIGEGDYCVDGNDIYGPYEDGDIATDKFIKIILTTDSQLIRYGVQAIDDEFLEWFVKNPTCEFIKVTKLDYLTNRQYRIYNLPQEEPKQDLEKEMFELEQELDIPSSMRWYNSKSKQETLEEVAERLHPVTMLFDHNSRSKHNEKYDCNLERRNSFIEGAKWQAEQLYKDDAIQTLEKGLALLLKKQERMHSEQIELINWLQQSLTSKKFYSTDAEDLIEQFKKK